jgi:very-short-patch-repair endonuclease
MRGPDRKKAALNRTLRRRSTDAETKLWLALRDRRLSGFKFVRQFAIEGCIADFACRERMLIVEVDGGQHSDSESDHARDRKFRLPGYRVVRFWNNDVLHNLGGVLTALLETLNESE